MAYDKTTLMVSKHTHTSFLFLISDDMLDYRPNHLANGLTPSLAFLLT